jgi:hypothetical protein
MVAEQQKHIGQQINIHAPANNGLAVAGFACSLLGLMTCGLLGPLGLLFSLLALIKPPRGMAFAGVVLGSIGSAWLFLGGFALFTAICTLPTAYDQASKAIEREQAKQAAARQEAVQRERDEKRDAKREALAIARESETSSSAFADPPLSPTPTPPKPAIAPSPEPEPATAESDPALSAADQALLDAGHKFRPRLWQAAVGKFSVVASFHHAVGEQITLVREHTGKQITIERSKLSEADQTYLQERGYLDERIEIDSITKLKK